MTNRIDEAVKRTIRALFLPLELARPDLLSGLTLTIVLLLVVSTTAARQAVL
jgi:hypothetical protein